MRIALCLHGYFKNAGGMDAAFGGWEYMKKKILNDNDVDVFVHSWEQDPGIHFNVEQMYKPVDALYEPQRQFEESREKIDESWFDDSFDREETMYRSNSVFQTLSFLYSRKRSIELKAKHEKENNFKYDCVVIARFDLGTRGKEHPQKYYATNINFDKNLDMKFLYSAFWDQMNWGYADHWFYSNSENMDLVGTAYDKALEYYDKDSDYVKAITTGWPDSNSEDEFSNEKMKDDKSVNLAVFDKWGCIDNHKLYKWFFMDTGLYDKSKFLDITEG